MEIDFKKPAQEIADELIRQFHIAEGASKTSIFYEDAVTHAIKAVSLALQVCPEILNENCVTSNGFNCRQKNPDHAKLTEVLQILKSKI